MQPIKLSVCYMVKNEANTLPISLDSIKSAADEIIVVDTGSTDSTKKIAASYGARLYDFPWQDDFSAPRNFAIEQARGTWILFLDADEYFAEPLEREKILAYLDSLGAKDVVLLLRQNAAGSDAQTSWNTDWCLRIFRNLSQLRYQGRIHENIARQDGELQVAYGPVSFRLLHTGYAGPLGTEKARRNLRLIEQAIAEEGWQPGYDYYLMDCFYGLGEYEKAMQHGKNFLVGDCYAYGGESHIYHVILECMRALQKPDREMLPWAQEACRKYPSLPEFYAEQGMILCGLGRLAEARQLFIEALLRYEEHTADVEQDGYFSQEVAAKVAARLGEIAMHYENLDEAAVWFKQSLEYCSSNRTILSKVEKFLQWAEKKQKST